MASALREKLATVNWARAGLGLPLVRVSLSLSGHTWASWVGGDSIGQAGDTGSFLQIDEVVSPEPEPLNTSDFSDWSSFNGEWQSPPAVGDFASLLC